MIIRKQKHFIFCLIIFLLFLSGCINTEDNIRIAKKQDLELEINMNDQIFSSNSSEINIEVSLINLNSETVYIEKGFDLGNNLFLELTLPNNISMKPAVDQDDRLPEKVKLNDEKKIKINLKEYIFYDENPSIYYDWNVTGEYNIQFTYNSYYMNDILYSNKEQFEIIV